MSGDEWIPYIFRIDVFRMLPSGDVTVKNMKQTDGNNLPSTWIILLITTPRLSENCGISSMQLLSFLGLWIQIGPLKHALKNIAPEL